MAWGHCVILLVVVVTLGPGLGQQTQARPGPLGLKHNHTCGAQGMQLRVVPKPGRAVHIKVVDEFGNQFDVNNCSICYHWLTSQPQGAVVFSTDYKGCHVLEKDGHFHLRVVIEALLPDHRVEAAQDITLICPKSHSPWVPATQLVPSAWVSSYSTPPQLPLHPSSGSSPTLPSPLHLDHSSLPPTPASPSLGPSPTGPDPGSPTGPDPGSPTGPDPGSPTGPDPGSPTGPDPGSPTGPDPGSPTGPDPGSPTGPDPGSPTGPDPGSPTGPDPGSPTGPDPGSPTGPDPGSPTGPDPGSPTGPDPGSPQQGTLDHWDVDKPAHIGTPLTQEQCRVASGHIPCTVRRNSKEACQQAGCCYDNTREVPCYYGNTATVRCFRDGHLLLVVSRETALAHRITLANTHLAHAPTSCPPAQKTDAFVVFRFPLTHCGTTAQVVGNRLIYENQLVSGLEVQRGPRGSVTWDSTFQLHVRCIFNASNYLPVQALVFQAPPPGPVTQAGPLRLELRIAKDETFSSFYEEEEYPIWKLLRQPLHVEVRLLQRADPGLVLMLHQCWASPSANPFQQPQWPVLSDGCPFNGDSYRTQMVALEGALPLPSHRQRFTVTTFAFLDKGSHRALREPVYFFCSASACHPSGLDTCSLTCSPESARQRRQSSGDHRGPAGPWDIVSSPGPVGFEDVSGQEPTVGATGSPRDSSSRLLLWVPLMLLALVLLVGASVLPGLRRTWAPQ